MSTIGNRIKARRMELGISVDELAAKLGKNRATIYRYESDDIENMPLEVVPPLAKALNTTPAYIMGWTDNKPVSNEEDGLKELAEKYFDAIPENRKAEAVNYLRFLASADTDNK